MKKKASFNDVSYFRYTLIGRERLIERRSRFFFGDRLAPPTLGKRVRRGLAESLHL